MPGGGSFERFKSKCGGDKADTNNSNFNDKNKIRKSIIKKKTLLKGIKSQKKINLKGTVTANENFKILKNKIEEGTGR